MITELRQKSQITMPAEMVKKFSLNTGDKFEVFEQNGMICFMPVVVYPKKYVDNLKLELESVKKKLSDSTQPVYDTVDDLFDALDKD